MHWCMAGDAALRYAYEGDHGPIVVLIHEMGGAIESWDRVVPQLLPHCRVVRFDTRGAGMSEKLIKPVGVEEMADDVAALLDRIGVDEPVCIAGCAVGAGIALSFAARYPARTSAVIVMNPAISVTAENKPGLLERAEGLRAGGTKAIVEASLSLGYPQVLRDRDPEHFAEFRARWLANDPASLRLLFLMLADMDLTPVLPGITCPVLGISGVHDVLRPTSYIQHVLSYMPDTRIVLIDAGHHMPDQAPDEVAAEILKFVREVEAA